jgi:hypothetical protein
MMTETHCCNYADCTVDTVYFDKWIEAWLCKEHEDSLDNPTGYCGRDCQLGHGCDTSC